MRRDAGMHVIRICCGMLLTGILAAGAAAAAVTHGDLMVVVDPKREGKVDNVCSIKFYSPKGKVNTSVRVKGFNWVFARALSQRKYAAVGLTFLLDGGYRALGPQKVPLKVVLLQLSGASPKVLGTRTLPYIHNPTWRRGKHCHYAGGNPLALRSKILPKGAGAVLHLYLSIVCVPATDPPDECAAALMENGTSFIQHWSMAHNRSKTLGPLRASKRVPFPETIKCGAGSLSLAVTANGKTYVAFAFNVKLGFVSTIGVYEVQHSRSGGMRMVPTWKFKIGGLDVFHFQLTGPSTACGIGLTPRGVSKIYSLAKGRAPFIGGKSADGDNTLAVGYNRYYQDISCMGSEVYAVLASEDQYDHTPDNVLRVSIGGLSRAAIGHVVFKAPQHDIPNVMIIP